MTELPASWTEAYIEELGLPSTPNLNPSKYPEEVFELYSVPSFADGKPEIIQGKEIKSAKQVVKPGDILLCKIVPHLNRVWVVGEKGNYNQIASGEWIVVRSPICDSYYLRYGLSEPMFREKFMETVSGVGGSLLRARPKAVAKIPLPLAPAPEQRRIVTKLDTLFARIHRAREELARIPILIEHYKQAVLAAAYETLLSEEAKLIPIGDLSDEVRNGISRKPHDAPPGTKILRISSVRPGYVNVEDVRFYIPEIKEEITKYYLRKGDLLFTRYNGNPDYVAVCGMFPECEETFVYPDKLIRVRLNTERVLPEFIEIIMRVPQVREILRPYIKTAAGQHGISGKDLKQTPVPIVPLHRQRQFVETIRKQLNSIQYVKKEQKHASELLDRLEKATLSKAFRGELVAQDPNDEPADILLERIRVKSKAAMKISNRARQRSNKIKTDADGMSFN